MSSRITGAPKIAVHFAHRVGALLVTALVLAHVAVRLVAAPRSARADAAGGAALALVAIQVTLGALTVLSRRDPWINSVHVVCGALVLTTSLVITLRCWRVQIRALTDRGTGALTEHATADERIGLRGLQRRPAVTNVARRAREERSVASTPRRSAMAGTPSARSLVADYIALTKPRLNFLVVATSAAGYYLGATAAPTWLRWRSPSPARRSSPAARRC